MDSSGRSIDPTTSSLLFLLSTYAFFLRYHFSIGIYLPSAVVTPTVFRSAGQAGVAFESIDAVIEQQTGSEGLSSLGERYGLPRLNPRRETGQAAIESCHSLHNIDVQPQQRKRLAESVLVGSSGGKLPFHSISGGCSSTLFQA